MNYSKFNVFELARAFKYPTDSNKELREAFKNFEKNGPLKDKPPFRKENCSEEERCLAHCQNMINGKITEYLLYKYYGKAKGWEIPEEDFCCWNINRPTNLVNSTDVFHEGLRIEFKSRNRISIETILNQLNNPWLNKSEYHDPDLVIVWHRNIGMVIAYYKTEDGWTKKVVEEFDEILISKMEKESKDLG